MARWSEAAVCELSGKAWSAKRQSDALLSECYEYAMPDRNPYHGNGTGRPQGQAGQKGNDKTSRRVYDSTLQTDAVKLANRIQYELFPIGHEWASLVPGAFVPQEATTQARSELYSLQKLLFMAIQFSNFDLSIAEWLLELVIAGTACMLVQRGDDDQPIVFQTVPQSHIAMREGALGKIDLVSREHKMRQSLIRETWQDAKVPEGDPMVTGSDDDDPEVSIIDVCYYSTVDRVWYYDVIATAGLKGHKREVRLVERTHRRNPWIIARWNKSAEEVQGRSLVMQALPDARVLSAVKSYLLRNAALAIGGAFLVRHDNVVNANTLRIFPGATIPVRSTGGGNTGASVVPLQVGGDVNLAQLVINDLVNSIHKIMMNDGMPDISEGVRSATELIERMKELQQSLGAPFARILKEGVVPMLEAAIAVLADVGIVPLQAGQRIKLNDGNIQVKFASPLVQGQSIREVDALRNAALITREIGGQMGGEEAVALSFKVEAAGRWISQRLGVVPEMVRTEADTEGLQVMAGKLVAMQQAAGKVDLPAANQQQQAGLRAAA